MNAPDYSTQTMTECYRCRYMRPIPGECHISCINPYPRMEGDPHGIKNGWFFYPFLFDPTWKRTRCPNFQPNPQAPENRA